MQKSHGNSGGTPVFVGAFGKHPGWNDHIDDIGLETDRLVAFKRLLYVEGIGGNVDSGTWERLAPEQRLPGFGSEFLSLAGGVPLIGRMWASEDGKGRGRYPMVICAQASGRTLMEFIEQAGPILAAAEAACRVAKTAEEVRAAVAVARAALTPGSPTVGPSVPPPVPSAPPPDLPPGRNGNLLAELARGLEPIQDGRGFPRLIHKVDRDMAAFRADSSGGASRQGLSQQIRVPSVMDQAGRELLAWTAAMLGFLDARVPLFLNRPYGAGWVDILVGAPKAAQFYCLLASAQAIPCVTAVPYNVDATVAERARRVAGDWREGREDVNARLAQASTDGNGYGGPGLLGRVRQWFGG